MTATKNTVHQTYSREKVDKRVRIAEQDIYHKVWEEATTSAKRRQQ